MREIPGWAGDIYAWQEEILAKAIPPGGTYLEIGTFLGASLAHIGTLRPDIQLIAVDPWLDEPKAGWDGLGIYKDVVEQLGGLWFAFLHMMKTHAPDVLRRTHIMRGTAWTLDVRGWVDAIFIDGAHDFDSVALDSATFAPRVRPGGIVSGHDYNPDFPGVVKAVTERYGKVSVMGTCWWVTP